MTAEQRQALIWRCRDAVSHLKQLVEVGVRGGRYSVTEYRYQLMINEIALAALTAPPVKLPGISELTDYSGCMPNIRDVSMWSEAIKLCAENIRAVGYEVQE
ncbi:MAG: hypothetical protein ACJ8LD_19845 [Pantoea agglomerans]